MGIQQIATIFFWIFSCRMEWLIHDIEKNGKAVTQMEAAARPVPYFEGSL